MNNGIETNDQDDFEIKSDCDWSVSIGIMAGFAFLAGIVIVAGMAIAVIVHRFFEIFL